MENYLYQAYENSLGQPCAMLAPADADLKSEDFAHYGLLTGPKRASMLKELNLPAGAVDDTGALALDPEAKFKVGANKGLTLNEVMARRAEKAAAADIQVGAVDPA